MSLRKHNVEFVIENISVKTKMIEQTSLFKTSQNCTHCNADTQLFLLTTVSDKYLFHHHCKPNVQKCLSILFD